MTSDTAPRVSVIIATYNRAVPLEDLLQDLMAQDYPPEQLEVIVVDDGSTDTTAEVIRRAITQASVSIRSRSQNRQGQAAARNQALAIANGEIVAFTDSDCRVGPHWVSNAVRHMTGAVGLVSGPILPIANPARAPGFFNHQIQEFTHENALYPTANVFYLRAALDQVGGFDEHFGQCSLRGPANVGEDIDLAWRVKRAGFVSAFAADAIVSHEATGVSPFSWLTEPIAVSVFPHLIAKYPELRREHLWKHYFLSDTHPLFYLAMAGVTLAGWARQPRWLALLLPWLLRMRPAMSDDLRAPSRWWRVPIKYALMGERFLLITLVLAWSSARHRTPVL